MSESPGVQPWNEAAARSAVLDVARRTVPVPIEDLEPTPGPATYLLWFDAAELPGSTTADGSLLSLFGPLAKGLMPVYAGAATTSRDRVQRHKVTLRNILHLEPADVLVTELPADSVGAALYMEDVLIRAVDPICNRPGLRGLGSRHQGRHRVASQRPTDFDCVLPRSWAMNPDPIRRLRVIADLVCYVTDPALGLGWKDGQRHGGGR